MLTPRMSRWRLAELLFECRRELDYATATGQTEWVVSMTKRMDSLRNIEMRFGIAART